MEQWSRVWSGRFDRVINGGGCYNIAFTTVQTYVRDIIYVLIYVIMLEIEFKLVFLILFFVGNGFVTNLNACEQ